MVWWSLAGCEQGVSASLSSFFLCAPVVAFRRIGQVGAVAGGLWPMVLRHNRSQCVAHGQWAGRCRMGRRWGRASRAGMVMRRRRRVAPRATACAPPARMPAARCRLWAMAAHSIQAEFAPKRPEGMWARGPSMRSANTVSMIAWRR